MAERGATAVQPAQPAEGQPGVADGIPAPDWMRQAFSAGTCERCGDRLMATTLYWGDAPASALVAPRYCWHCCEERDRERYREAMRATLHGSMEELSSYLTEAGRAFARTWHEMRRALEPAWFTIHNALYARTREEELIKTPAGVMTRRERGRRLRNAKGRAYLAMQMRAAALHKRALALKARNRTLLLEVQALRREAERRKEKSLTRKLGRLARRVRRVLS
jgi:hypothetical protein